MAEELLVSVEGLSHFKAKQDLEYEGRFKRKDDATDLVGAVRYDTAQVLTPEQKAQARANIGAGTGDGTGSGTTDYNELENRPVYGDVVYSYYNSKIDGYLGNFTLLDYNWYKVSALTPSREQMSEAKVTIGNVVQPTLTEDYIIHTIEKDGETVAVIYAWDNMAWAIAIAYKTGNFEGEFQGQAFTVSIFTTGIHLAYQIGESIEDTRLTFEIEYGDFKRLDEKYIPLNIPRLDADNGRIPARYLPSYVDDVVEGYYDGTYFFSKADTIITDDYSGYIPRNKIQGERGVIYLDLNTNNTYRYSGQNGEIYIRINPDEYTVATNADIDALFT